MKTKTKRSKYRFSQTKSYIDKNGIRYHYDCKYMGIFHFFVLNANYKLAHFNELELDLLNIQLEN
jgi:hypothetical protein